MYVQGTLNVDQVLFSLVPSFFPFSAATCAITTFALQNCGVLQERPAKKIVSALTCYTHAARRCGNGGISRHSRTYGHAREHVNGTCHRWFFESHLSTKAARLFPFYSSWLSSSLWSFSRNLYLPTYVPLHGVVPAAANDERTGITWPGLVRAADKPPLSIGIAQRAVRHDRYSCECKCTRIYFTWAALSPCSSRLVNFCSLTGHHAHCAAGLSIAVACAVQYQRLITTLGSYDRFSIAAEKKIGREKKFS